MCGLKTWAWTVALAVATASPAFAQQAGTTGTTGAATTGGTRATTGTGTGGITSGGTTTSGLGGSGAGGVGSGAGGNGTGTTTVQNYQMEAAPNIAAPTGTARSSLHASNRFAGYYANPYMQGSVTATNTAPGGFGLALYPATTGTGTVTGGRAGGAGAAGQRGLTTNTQSGILIPLPVQISYVAQMRFPTPPVASPALVADLRGIIDRGGFANPKSVQVIANGTDITLRGTVRDDDEARLAEGLVRLTPGVGNITNELSYPLASK
jgi:hypothetical protein